MRTLAYLLRKEYLQIFRDRFIMLELLLVPIIQLAILANAATFEVRTARLAVVDEDRSATSRGLVRELVASGRFRVVDPRPAGAAQATPPAMRHAADALLRRDVDAVLRVPHDFERDLVRARAAPAQLVLNAEDGAAAGVTLSYAQRIVGAYAAGLGAPGAVAVGRAPSGAADDGIGPAATDAHSGSQGASIGGPPGAPAPAVTRALDVRTRGWYNPTLRYSDYMVPGILVELVTLIGTLLTALNIVREKELGTLEQLNVTPVTRAQFIAAKLLPLWSLALVTLAIGLVVARFGFGVPLRGSLALVFASAAVYLLAALGVGLLISTAVETQQQAMFVTFFIVMIYLLMSGLFTPVASMPRWAQWIAQGNPMLHYVEMMRAILLKGASLPDVLRPLAILAAYGAGVLALAVARYRKASA
jgi:ABC-2 type transport system permease protein